MRVVRLTLLSYFVGLFFNASIYGVDFETNCGQVDGFGSQFQHAITCAVYAELHNKEFRYTPFMKMEHNYDNDPVFLERKEWLINFIGNFPVNSNHTAHSLCNYRLFFDNNIVQCAESHVLKKIKKFFRDNKDPQTYYKADTFNLAVHVRRPNSHDNRLNGADTPDELFLRVIEKLRSLYSAENPHFHIYSQGKEEAFELYKAPDSTLHLNESIEDTFCGMVFADVLVAGRTSFSYTAGLISEGKVYYIPFWHTPLPHWISVQELLR